MKSKLLVWVVLACPTASVALWLTPASGRAGEIYVTTATGTGKVGEYETTGATINASLVGGLSQPYGVAVSGGDLFVANFGTGTVGEYNATTGAAINVSLISGLGEADTLALSGNDLFVSTAGNNTVGEYNATTGAPINASFITGLNYPGQIAASGGNLYIAQANDTIGEYNATTGAAINAALITGLANPALGIAVSGSELFVTEFQDAIAEYSATTGSLLNASLVGPVGTEGGIAVFGGDLFAVVNNGVAEYTTSGTLVNASLVRGLTEPYGIAVTPEPATWVMLAIGGAALFVCGRRRRNPASNQPSGGNRPEIGPGVVP